jgi:hypothetical protein
MAKKSVDDEAEVKAKIAALPWFQEIASTLHDVIMRTVPELKPRLWYGMPGYARTKTSPVICFFRVDGDDYVTLGLTEKARLAPDKDAGHQLIGSAWFLTELDAPTEARIADIVRSAAG